MINIDLNFLNKELELAPIRTLFVQGENVADIIKINMPKMYNDIDLESKVFVIKMLNRAGEYYEAVLPKNVSGESIVLEWTVTKEFTSVHGILKINVIALDDDGSVFSSKEGILEIQPAVMSSGIPITPETIFEDYLQEMRMLAEASLESSETSQVILADMNSKIVNDVVTGGRDKVLSAEQGKILDDRIDNIVGYSGTSTVEVVDARNSPERGVVYPTLKARLDAVDGDIVKSTYSTPTDATAPIISLPSTVVKGKLEGSIKGNTLYQVVVNGDFANGTIGWGSLGSSLSASNNVLSVTGSGTGVNATLIETTNLDLIGGQKIFWKTKQRVTNAVSSKIEAYLRMDSSPNTILSGGTKMISSPVINQWYELTGIATVQAGIMGKLRFQVYHQYADEAIANGKVMEIDGNIGVFAIPITGTPYENLTADQINAMIDGYWEGLGGTQPSRVKSVGKNLLKTNLMDWEQGTINPTTGFLETNLTAIRTSSFVKLKQGTYRISSNPLFFLGVRVYDKNKIFVRSTSASTITISGQEEFIKFVCILNAGGNINVNNIELARPMLNEGSTALPYEPYKETELFCPVVLNSLPNGIKDEFYMDGKHVKRVGIKTSQTGVVNYTDMATGGSFIASLSDGTIQTGIKGATLTATATKIIYQLATPIETQYPSANLIAEASGSIYVDSSVKALKSYTTKITLDTAIKNLESVTLVTGDKRTPIATSLVTIATDGLSATILNATANQIYELVYTTNGKTLGTLDYKYPNNMAAQVQNNTTAVMITSKMLNGFIAYQNTVNLQFDFRLITGGH